MLSIAGWMSWSEQKQLLEAQLLERDHQLETLKHNEATLKVSSAVFSSGLF